MNKSNKSPQDTKEVFKKCGTCSQTFGYLLNRAFDHPQKIEELALNPLAGGIMNSGNQCGMLWGATLAVGAEAFRRHDNSDHAIAVSVTATQHIIASFLNRTNTVNCREITGYKLNSVFGLTKFMLKSMITGMNNNTCFNLAEKWAPEAIQTASDSLAEEPIHLSQQPISCASEVVKKMGASKEEMVMVSGFAGGLGLSGNACGALSATIWMATLKWCKDNPGKNPPFLNNAKAKKILKTFYKATDSEILCKNICGQSFKTIDEHTVYIQNGGCKNLINILANSS